MLLKRKILLSHLIRNYINKGPTNNLSLTICIQGKIIMIYYVIKMSEIQILSHLIKYDFKYPYTKCIKLPTNFQ